jgi:hypothetical protein
MRKRIVLSSPKSAEDPSASRMGVVPLWRFVALASVFVGSAGLFVPSASPAVEAPRCEGAGIDIELCVVPGVRDGTFLLQDRDLTVVASIPSDPSSCPDQTFEVKLEYPKTKPDGSIPREQRTTPALTVRASASSCAKAAPPRVLRLERSEARYGLGQKDLDEGVFAPSIASVGSLNAAVSTSVFDAKLQSVKPSVAVDSLTQLSGPFVIVSGKPCGRAKLRAACKVKYAKALANPTPYGRSNCGRCPVGPQPLVLVYTRRDEVRFVSDLKAFLGPIDTAADAALLREGTVVAALKGGAWLVMRNEIDGTCDPFERSEVYERVQADGGVEPIARLLVSRQFGMCA